ncbi:helix-turn-helix transcriptional regulator [Streptomyces sp. NBC_00572]|uniref:ArsR/SmtB family transcription factor n=1 Tax=Streptomyces sp. NBC_00572 TaxID=2903664 RepID=UPI0022540B2B|nr:winged helix-turn-helix domain-containing protein [Streptomyces sp. NBC_00572]MCX4985687.1 winged helix-turn-helix domain-containing protein [Streptomyces sp. NBC_00572]
MIRLHFTAADLRRVTLAPTADALSETALSLRLGLRTGPRAGRARTAARQWHRSLPGGASARAGVLAELVTQDGFVPDFLTQPSARDFGDALEAAASTPTERLALDLGIPDASGWNGALARPGRWAYELAQGVPAASTALVDDTRRYFRLAVEPLWPRIRSDALTDRALRAEMLLRGGVDALLTTLGTTWCWQAPTLHLPSASTYDIPLCGRGLHLVPSWFATGPMVMYRPEEATVLVYPMYDDGAAAGPAGGSDDRPEALAALLGRTRAQVLALLRAPATTTALAERAGVSLAAASQHAGVLRGAGLITTVRTGTSVLHSVTPLGASLLAGL